MMNQNKRWSSTIKPVLPGQYVGALLENKQKHNSPMHHSEEEVKISHLITLQIESILPPSGQIASFQERY